MARSTTSFSRRGLLGGFALLGLASSSCGWILYPERRGRTGGPLDGRVLLVDIIWLIPGLIPGIVCLIVDFSTGCIYGGGERRVEEAPQTGEPVAVTVELEGREIARGEVGADGRAHLAWNEQVDAATLRAHGRVIAVSGETNKAQARLSELV